MTVAPVHGTGSPDDGSPPPAARRAIADGIVRLYRNHYGRGPRRISVHVAPEAVVCVLRGVNTPLQASLVAFGDLRTAQDTHERLQLGMAGAMSAVVEEATGQRVVSYVPGFNAADDVTTDAFLLATDGVPAP